LAAVYSCKYIGAPLRQGHDPFRRWSMANRRKRNAAERF
jgi:hypothetical protein